MIRVLQIGCGKMSKYSMRYVYEKGAEIVGAFDISEHVIGKDIGTLMETEEKGVKVQNLADLAEFLKENRADIAIVTTRSLIEELRDVVLTLVNGKVNVVTTCEEAFFAENSNKLVFDEIDRAAKENGVTVTGGGYQDIFWGNLISILAGSIHNITKIKGSSSYNVEDYGIALAEVHGAGLTLAEFDEKIAKPSELSNEEIKKQVAEGTFAPSYMWNVVGWLADKLGYHITEMSQKCIPQTNVKDIHSTTLGMDVKAGDATGMSAVVTAKTAEGVEIEAECIGKVYDETEFDKNVWSVIGEPDTTVSVERPDTVRLTCADIVNRIPDIINAKPGFVPTSQMADPRFRVEALDKYLK
ncbi:MAG: dihydrodipicolinate reductase [Clostridiales bacterium]|nr:dihydrodipicolinate reductase [Clostridiales bacterium]